MTSSEKPLKFSLLLIGLLPYHKPKYLRHKFYNTYCFILCGYSFLYAFKAFGTFSHFEHYRTIIGSDESVLTLAIGLANMCSYYMAAAILRAVFIYGWAKTGRLKQIYEMSVFRSEKFQKRRSVTLLFVAAGCWGVWLVNGVFLFLIFSTLGSTSPMAYWIFPFDLIFPTDRNNLLAGIWLVVAFIPDTGFIFAAAFFIKQVIFVAWRFLELSKELSEMSRRIDGNRLGPDDVEQLRLKHLLISKTVRKLDRAIRPAQFALAAFSFNGALIYMYQVVQCQSDDCRLLQTVKAIWLILTASSLIMVMLPSAYLEHCSEKVRESFFKLRIRNPNVSETGAASVQLNMLLAQICGEPVAMTLLGTFRLRRETLFGLMGVLLTYFLILFDYTSGDKAGYLNIADGSTKANRTK